MKIMISQPMRGKSNEEIRRERKNIVETLTRKGYTVVNSIISDYPPKDCDEAIYYLSKSIEIIGRVDCLYFMKGWEKARGCKIEHEVAVNYNKECMYEN